MVTKEDLMAILKKHSDCGGDAYMDEFVYDGILPPIEYALIEAYNLGVQNAADAAKVKMLFKGNEVADTDMVSYTTEEGNQRGAIVSKESILKLKIT